MTRAPDSNTSLTVLLIDDTETQSARIQECLHEYRVGVEWRPSYRAAAELLHDPDLGQLIDLILIDQDFNSDEVRPEDLLTHSEVGGLAGTDEWDVRLHQGLFIMARLSQDMREGLIPFAPMMILTHYARLDVAAQVGFLGGYESKRRLITDPYTALEPYLGSLQPTEADVDDRLAQLQGTLSLRDELTDEVRRQILCGLDLEEACTAVGRLSDPNDWRSVGRALERLAEQGRTYAFDRLASAIESAWLASADGWLRVRHVEPAGLLDHGFEAFQVEIARPGTTYPALLAARALPPDETPAPALLRHSFRLLRAIDGRSRPVRLRDGCWTIVGCWVQEPQRSQRVPGAAAPRLLRVTRHVRELHGRGLAHGSLTVQSTGFEPPVFGGLRCLAGAHDLSELRRDDLRRLPALAVAAYGESPPVIVRQALDRWSAALGAGDLEAAERILESARLRDEPPAYYDFDRSLYSGGELRFRDLLLASLGGDDAVLREVRCDEVSSSPVDFVVCAGGALAVLEHRARLRRVMLSDGDIAGVETGSAEPEAERCRRSVVRSGRSADVLAARVEAAMGLPSSSIRRLSAVVVPDGTVVEPAATTAWRPVVTEAEAAAELVRLSRAGGTPRGVDMAGFLSSPDPQIEARAHRRRALRWTTLTVAPGLTRMRTWRKQWPAGAWRPLLAKLATARAALHRLDEESRPLRLAALRAYDDDGEPRDITHEAASVDVVEYDVRMPGSVTALATYFGDSGSEADRRRMAADVLRNLLSWERCWLAYEAMEPDGVVQTGGSVYCDLLESVAPLDAESRWRMRCGAASCLVFLLSPWPYAWPAVTTGTMPALHEQSDERSAWGIASSSVASLLDPDHEPARLEAALFRKVDLLEAAAVLDGRFPAWPAGLSREIQP